MGDIPHSIVILEDDAGLRRAIERLMRLSGYSTQSFRSAEDANLTQCVAQARCLIVDVQLPGASGPAFYAALNPPRPPAVFITAYDSMATRAAVASTGHYALLNKPFLGDALLSAVQQAMSKGS